MRSIKPYIIVDRIGILTDTFTAATTDICTQSSHGLKNGDPVVLTTSGTLPAGLSLATVYYIIDATTNTFKLSLIKCPTYTTISGVQPPVPVVDITDTGTGNHTYTMHDIGNNINVDDFRHCIVSVDGDDSANIDFGFVGSIGKSATSDDAPDFSAAATLDNQWAFVEVIGYINGTAIDGSATQISQVGTNFHTMYEININGMKWLNILMSGWSAGNVTVRCRLYND